MNNIITGIAAVFFAAFICAQNLNAQDKSKDKNVESDILRYGTDGEISELIKSLKKDNLSYLDDDLAALAKSTKSPVIKTQVIVFFADRSKEGLEDEAVYLIDNRDDVESQSVLAAIDYLGKIKYSDAQKTLRSILESKDGSAVAENAWTNPALRAIGSASKDAGSDEAAKFLIDYYETKNPSEETQREIVTALGDTGSREASGFLSEIIKGNERPALVISAMSAAAKIGGDSNLNAISEAVSSKDPNVRAAAVEALGGFEGDAADNTVLEAFRDSHWRTRLAAVKAAGKRKLATAVPYLKFRAEKDEVPNIQDEAIRSLGAIGNSACAEALESIFDERRTPDRLKSLAAQFLIQIDAGRYAEKIITRYAEAKRLAQKQLAAGLLSALGKAKTDQVRSLTGQLFASKDPTDKAFALELTAINGFSVYRAEVERLAGENSGISRKARDILQKL